MRPTSSAPSPAGCSCLRAWGSRESERGEGQHAVNSYAPPVQRLITELSRLPGVGGRTAQRLAFHILRASDDEAGALADAIREVKERIGLCDECFNLADGPRCRICSDERRDRRSEEH